MVETAIVLIIAGPIGGFIALYQFCNGGRLPCIDMDNIDNPNRATVAVEG
jgi:hypothetical protein